MVPAVGKTLVLKVIAAQLRDTCAAVNGDGVAAVQITVVSAYSRPEAPPPSTRGGCSRLHYVYTGSIG